MDRSLMLRLSGFGAFMAVATVYVIPTSIEPFCWLAIFGVCAVLIARFARGKPFLHGLGTSLCNCLWVTSAHFLLYDSYAAHHADEIAQSASLPGGARVAMLYIGPVIGIVSGVVLGTFAWAASKLVKRAG